jgi:tetratricopeptide (TPR) repeat protein
VIFLDIKSYFNEKLSKVLFLEFTPERIKKLFNASIEEKIYVPLRSSDMLNEIKNKNNLDEIPIAYFIEGIFFVIGADKNFKYVDKYKKIILARKENTKFIKGKIFENIKNKNYEEAYILLKGLLNVEKSKENFNKLIMLCDNLRQKDSMYKDEEKDIINLGKSIDNYALPYLYEAILQREEGKYEKALFNIDTYILKGGKETAEVIDIKQSLESIVSYEKGKSLVSHNPEEALKILVPLMDEMGNDANLIYFIAVAYRNIENYEKAIYYLNEALSIDSNIVEIFNELGINYASLGDFNNAILYFRKVFEVTKSIEVCTNLVMCYLNINDINQSKIHYEIAKKINPKDEVVMQLKEFFEK